MEIQHFCHDEHPLVFNEDKRGHRCWAYNEPILGPTYRCTKCEKYYHHKSCAKLHRELQHPSHQKHPLILFNEMDFFKDKIYSKCEVCKQYRGQYTYGCSLCNFNLHSKCASLLLTIEFEVHEHPLTCIWRLMKFTCDLRGKEGNVPYLCVPCNFGTHKSCTSYPCSVKAIHHDHLLHLTYSSLEVHQSISQFCQLCVQKVDTNYGFYYCLSCDFVVHLDCAMDEENREDINLMKLKYEESSESENEDSELDESNDSVTYIIKKINVGEDGIEIAKEIKHFSHEHDLKLIDEVENNKHCDGCLQAILPPFYNCVKCSLFLHKSCVELPKKNNTLFIDTHLLFPKAPCRSMLFWCDACGQLYNGFTCKCNKCDFDLDVQCSLVLDVLTHKGREHCLCLSSTRYGQNCSSCYFERSQGFRCITCEFALDFKCATLPYTTRYKQHEHLFILSYVAEDNFGEYYCDICEEERDPKQWFYYCANCNYPAHPKYILGKYPNFKFGVSYTFHSEK